MARITNGILNTIFGASAGAGDAVDPSSIFSTGWPDTYEDPTSGLFPEREYFNFLFRALYSIGKDVNTHGILEWSNAVDYTHPAFVVGSDNEIYKSLQSSGPSGAGAQNPTTATTYWLRLSAQDEDLRNASFEVFDGSNIPINWGFTAYSGGSGAVDVVNNYHGKASFKFTHPGGSGNGGGELLSDFIPCSSLFAVRLSFIYRSSSALRSQIVINWYDDDKTSISSSTVFNSTGTISTAIPIYFDFTPPSTARFFRVKLIGGATSVNVAGNAWFDGVKIARITKAVSAVTIVDDVVASVPDTTTPTKLPSLSGTTTLPGTYNAELTVEALVVSDGTVTAEVYKNGVATGQTVSVTGSGSGIVRKETITPSFPNCVPGDYFDVYASMSGGVVRSGEATFSLSGGSLAGGIVL